MGMDGTIGVQEQGVYDAISDLDRNKAALDTWLGDMMTLKSQVVAEWLGDAAGQFDANYTRLDQDMRTMEDAIDAFKNWAQETLNSYAELDAHQTNSMSMI
ncbi:MAG: WXG100 family type VII secretion target [Butyrivibrio sp.]|nr:WXG100 family type VII secretion target [Butyrivibrio sp.]